MSKAKEAQERFKKGFNCSQAIFSAYSESMGIEREAAMKIASAFGGGMGCTGETCGAMTGALMVLGLRHGTAKNARQTGAYSAAREFSDRFRARHGATSCRELLSVDIGTPEGLEEAKRKNLFTSLCPRFVETAAEILEEMGG